MQKTWWGRGGCSFCLEKAACLHREICIFSSIVYLIMCLYGYVLWMFLLHFGSEPCTIYFIAQIVPVLVAGSPSVVFCVWDTLCSLLTLPTFWHDRKLQVLRNVLCPSPRISHFSREPWFLLLENPVRNRDLGPGWGLAAAGVLLLLSPLG